MALPITQAVHEVIECAYNFEKGLVTANDVLHILEVAEIVICKSKAMQV